MKIITIIIGLFLTFSVHASKTLLDDLKQEAVQKFPFQTKSLDINEVKAKLECVLKEEPKKMLATMISNWEQEKIFNPYNGIVPHENDMLVLGLRCLYINANMLLETKDPEDNQKGSVFQFIAAPRIPYKESAYTFGELEPFFSSILKTKSSDLFNSGMSILLDSTSKKKPKHTGKELIDAIRCLYGKCLYALTLDNPDQFQSDAIFKLYAFDTHKKIIKAKNTELWSRILLNPCPDCIKRAQNEFPQFPFDLSVGIRQ